MKKMLSLLFILIAVAAQAQTVDEVLAKYEAAVGGREKLQSIKQLQISSTAKLSVMGQDLEIPTTLVREKGHLFRRQIGGLMGMGDSYTLITDTSGALYVPAMRMFGGGGGGGFDRGGGFGGPGGRNNQPTIIRMKPEDVSAQQFELDTEGFFPELVNYAAKGHTAQLLGTEKAAKTQCYKIQMTLKTGQTVIYYIDTQTFLVKQMEATGDMALNMTGFASLMKAFDRSVKKDTKATIVVKEYQDFKGIKFPSKFVMSFGPLDSQVENHNVQINEGLEDKWYTIK
ncbi:MAG: hypothetical protein JO301_13535 [Chitinophagaceae bacterium]|nr:hypothetical protein [Chitinophagaceae bacterium]